MRSSCVLLALLMCTAHPLEDEQSGRPVAGEAASDKNQPAMQVQSGHLTVNSTIGEVIAHPAFAGFGRLLLPWDNRKPDGNMQLREISALLPYHSEVNPSEVVTALNQMIDDANNGKSIFYDFYAETQKNAEPTQRNAGLFFFRGKPGAPFAIVCPGGGFAYVASLHEGFPYAAEITKSGYNVFVLKYRAGVGGAAATLDLAAALSYVFKNARRLASEPPITLCGAARQAREWLPPLAPTEPHSLGVTFSRVHRSW